MVWTATDDGRVDFSNQRWREYAGDGRTWLDALHPDERQRVASQWNGAIGTREPVTIEARLRKGAANDGPYRTFVIRATPIVRGNAVKWLGACADVEDQKRLATERETQARQRSFFLNALSHDLRAPLNTVALNAHILKMSARDEADAEVANTVVENAIAAGDLVTRLLDFARVGEERTTADRVLVAAVLHQVRRRFMPAAAKKGLYLRVVTAAGDVEVTTDRHKLDRVLSNLVDNAIKYTPHGGVELALEHSGGRACVCVCVSDTGGGIPKECAPYLFDEFYQVNNHERDRTKGFGLGLTICKSLARKLGGDVRLARTGPDGTCFEFTFDTGDRGPGGPTDGTGGRGRRGGAAGGCPDPAEAGLCRS
jgi:signal transduction histidine kinase